MKLPAGLSLAVGAAGAGVLPSGWRARRIASNPVTIEIRLSSSLRFSKAIVRGIEIVTLDVETGERRAMPQPLRLFVRRRDSARTLPQTDRPRAAFNAALQPLERPSGERT